MLEREVTVIVPQRIGRNVLDDNGLAAEGCRAARAGLGADGFAVNGASETFRQARRGAVAHTHTIGVEQQDRAEHTWALRLGDTQEKVECFPERCPLGDEFQDLILAPQQLRAFTRRLLCPLALGNLVEED